jgi:hypothetical protein
MQYNSFIFLSDEIQNKLDRLSLASFFFWRVGYLCMRTLHFSPENTTLACNSLPMTNTLAYLILISVTKKKSVHNFDNRCLYYKTFYVCKLRLFISLSVCPLASLSSLVKCLGKARSLPYSEAPFWGSSLG